MQLTKLLLTTLIFSSIVISGCTFTPIAQHPELPKINTNGSWSSNQWPVEESIKDEQTLILYIKNKASNHYGNHLSSFSIEQQEKVDNNLFLNFTFEKEKELFFGYCHAYPTIRGWVVESMDIYPADGLFITGNSLLFNHDNNVVGHVNFYEGALLSSNIASIEIHFKDAPTYKTIIDKNQKTFLYLSKKKFTKKYLIAYDSFGKVVFKK